MSHAEVMVLGTFHFSNPGLDLLNPNVADILGERRQGEITEVIARLARFNPTKIALETLPTSTTMANRLAALRQGAYTLDSNEVDQLGLRLAQQLGHPTLYGIDYHNDFPFEAVQTWAATHGQGAYLAQTMGQLAQAVTTRLGPEAVERMTIREILYGMNLADADELGQAFYLRLLAIGADEEYPGADLVARWYERNLKIAANTLRLAADGGRILVIIGSGHGKLLKQFLRETPDVALIQATYYLA